MNAAPAVPATAPGQHGPLAYWPSGETLERRGVVRDLLRQRHDPDKARPAILGDEPYDPDLWQQLTAGMGTTAILAPEALGGLGLGYEDFAAICGELGRVLYTGPFFGSGVLALGALLPLIGPDGADGHAADLARQVIGGQTVATLAFLDARGRWAAGSQPAVSAADGPAGWQLTGRRHLVVNAPQADVFCVPATSPAGSGLFVVRAADADVTPVDSIDPTRSLGTLTLRQAPAQLLASGPDDGQAVHAAIRLARLAMAAEGVGAAEEALRLMVSYALSRRQFGRPIGGFQAVKHKCAEALIAIEAAKATVSYAAWALDDGSAEADLAILAAKIASTEAFLSTAADCIQVHGTFGYTREAAAQSYFRRARWLSLFLGSAEEDSQQLAGLLGV